VRDVLHPWLLLVAACDAEEHAAAADEEGADRGAGADTATATDAADLALAASEVPCDDVVPDATVDIGDLAFEPGDVSVGDGGVVAWVNLGSLVHTVTSGSPCFEPGAVFASGDLAPGDRYCLRFDGVGAAVYHCERHPLRLRDATVTVGPL
jgi:plastocyanin